jgi:hypothetical protein
MGKAIRWAAHHAGRRGAFLAFLAILDLAYGYGLLVASAPQRFIDLLLPYQAWGAIWIAAGLVCASGVFARADRLQFAVAATLKGAWGLLYLDIWLIQGLPRGWVSVVIWLAFALVVLLVSGWPEPSGNNLPKPSTPRDLP